MGRDFRDRSPEKPNMATVPGAGIESPPPVCGGPSSLLLNLSGIRAYKRKVGLLVSGFIFKFSKPGFLEVIYSC